MSARFTMRAIESDDAEALRAIYNWAVLNTTATFDVVERTPEEHQAWMNAHDGAPYPAVVAVTDCGDIAGYASLSGFSSKHGYLRTVENSLYVHPDWHGHGIGRALLAHLIERAQEKDFTTIVALISADNDVSLKLHRSLGFIDAGLLRRVGWKYGREIDVAYLQLFLRSSPETP